MLRSKLKLLKLRLVSKELLGALLVFFSAICFYLMSVAVKWASKETEIDSVFFLAARCAFSFVVVAALFAVRRRVPRPRHVGFVLARAFFYLSAVFCFFIAIEEITTAEANILHMTFPLYIALFSFLFVRGKRDYGGYLMTAAAFLGVLLIISPGGVSFRVETLWGVGAGMFGAVAILFLNQARKYDDADTILFYMFGVGAILLYILFPEKIHMPNAIEWKYLAAVTLFGGVGQYALTLGFKFVSAVEGGVISSSRILMAAVLGPFLVSDPALDMEGWIGALLIFGANVYLTVRRVNLSNSEPKSKGHVGTMV